MSASYIARLGMSDWPRVLNKLRYSPRSQCPLTAGTAVPQVAVVGTLSALLHQAGSVQNAYSSMCCKALSSIGTETVCCNPVVTPMMYWQGLKAGAAIQHIGASTTTQGNRDKAMQELAEWLAVYLVTWRAEEHGGCTAPAGKICCPCESGGNMLPHGCVS